jgi:hypothetical protein
MNKTELFIKLDKYENQSLMFDDTYLAPSVYGLFLGLEFQMDVSSIFSVGDIITIDKTNKSINPWADGTQSIIGITASSIYPAPGSLVFTDRPLQLPISFTSNENGVIYQGDSISSDWSQVDLSDDVAFPITFNIADVREINNRNGAYSKTVVIPGTKDNNKVFKYIFDIQGVDNYDTRVRVKANVVVDTIPVLEGYLQLDTINCDNNEYWTYNCIIYGENANFSKNIDQNALLNSLDFSEFDHYKTLDAITQSWVGDYTYGYYYPWLDYNSGKNPVDIFPTTTGLQQSVAALTSVINENFKPSIYVKQYWDKIFKLYGYTYESEFLNSSTFTDLVIPTNVKTLKNQDNWRFDSSFKAGIRTTATYSTIAGPSILTVQDQINGTLFPTTNILNSWTMSTTNPFFYNPQGVFTDLGPSASFQYQNSFDGTTFKRQKVVLNLDYKITPLSNTGFAGLGLSFFYKLYKNGTLLSIGKIENLGGGTSTFGGGGGNIFYNNQRTSAISQFGDLTAMSSSSFERKQMQIIYDTDINGDLNNNDTLEVRLGAALFGTGVVSTPSQSNYLLTKYKFDFYESTNGYNGCYFYNNIDTTLLPNQPISLSQTIPGNIKQIDFVNSIIKMFNLYLSQDKVDPKKIYIEPRDQFYTTNFVNWSRKLDISKDILQKPIVDRKKRVLMSYKEDKDLANTFYKSNYNEIYGQYEYKTGNEFDTSEQKIEVVFSPTPLLNRKDRNGNLDNRLVYTQILDPKGVINAENYNIVDSNIRILYKKNIPLSGTNFRIFDNVSYYTYNTYPYAGHLDDPTSPGLDLSFSEPLSLYYEYQNFGYTNNNLYTLYYEQFFEEVYGLESKHITAYVYLTAQDIIDFDYRKLVYLDSASSGTGGYFRVNKIEYDPFNKQSYKVELIKVLNNFKSKYNKKLAIGIGIGDVGVALPNWGTGLVTSENYNSGGGNIIAGVDNSVRSNLNIVSGKDNQILVGGSNIITGIKNSTIAENSGIISGGKTIIYGTGKYSNIIGGSSQSLSGPYSSIIGGCNNKIDTYSSNNQILGGCNNRVAYNPTGTSSISQTTNSLILGGINNKIEVGPTESATDNVFILGGQNNTIAGGVTNSFILGGENFTATQSNTIYLVGNILVNGSPISGGSGPQGNTGPQGFQGPSGVDGFLGGTGPQGFQGPSGVDGFLGGTGPQGLTGPQGPGSGSAINVDEVAFGTGTGITSSSSFKITSGRSLLVSNNSLTDLSSTANLAFGTYLSYISGNNNTILSSKSSCTDGGYNSIITSGGSFILGSSSTSYSNIIGSGNSCVSGNNNTIIGSRNSIANGPGYSNSIITSGTSYILIGGAYYSNIIGSVTSCVGGSSNTIIGSRNSSTTGIGYSNGVISSGTSGVEGYYNSVISSSNVGIGNAPTYNSIILSSRNSTISLNYGGPIRDSSIISGYNNGIGGSSNNAVVIGGTNHCFLDANKSFILGGDNNYINITNNSGIIGGNNNCLYSTYRSMIISSSGSCIITGSVNSVIIGGNSNTIGGNKSFIISGDNNSISATNSIIINGFGVGLTQSNTTYIGGYISLGDVSGLQAVSGGGPVTISTGLIKTTSKVFLTGMNGASDAWYVDNIIDGSSFDITALTTGGTGDVAWLILN